MTVLDEDSTSREAVNSLAQRKLRIFHAQDGERLEDSGLMARPELSAEASAEMDFEALAKGYESRVLFREDSPDGFSLVWLWFGANYPLPRHTHDTDCLYFVLSGQAILGKQILGPGSGLFIPAGTPYKYVPGPEGVQVLEFRKSTGFDIEILEQEVEHWRKFADTARSHSQLWDEQRPAQMR